MIILLNRITLWLNIAIGVNNDGIKKVSKSLCDKECKELAKFGCNGIDYSTYDILYSEKDIAIVCNNIIEFLIDNGSITINKIFDLWGDKYKNKFIWFAIERLLSTKLQIINRLGFPVYISSNEGTIFLQNDFPFNEDKDSNNLMYYSDIVVGISNKAIIQILDKLIESNQDDIIETILATENLEEEEDVDLVEEYLGQLNLTYKVKLLELILIEYMKSDELMQEYLKEENLEYEEELQEIRPIVEYIIHKYNMYIYTDILEPYMDISEQLLKWLEK